MEVGQTILAQLYTTNDADLQAIALKYLVGFEVGHLQTVVEGDIGADEGELCPGEHVTQGDHAAVPLVVAEGGEVEADFVHQLIHGLGRLGVAVVDGVARAVVTRAEEQQVGMCRAQAVDEGSQLWEVIDVGVHVVGRNDVDLLFLLAGGKEEHGGQGRQNE